MNLTPRLLSFVLALLFISSAGAQTYQPPSLRGIAHTISGEAHFCTVILTLGSAATPTVIVHYEGGGDYTRTATVSSAADNLGQVTVNVPLPGPANSPARYFLGSVELADSGGNTVYSRFDRTSTSAFIARLFYSVPSSYATNHIIDFRGGDYGTEGVDFGGLAHARNLSTRGFVGTDDQALIVGIVVSGGRKSFLFRAIGPGLAQFGVAGFVADPKMELRDSAGKLVASNDNWGPVDLLGENINVSTDSVGAFQLPTGSRDAAMRATLSNGSYTLVITGANGSTGVALAEAYELR